MDDLNTERSDDPAPAVSNRRNMLRLLAAGVAGAAATALRPAGSASAADNAALLQGVVNTGNGVTTILSNQNTALFVNGAGGYGIEADGNSGNALFVAAGTSPLGDPANAGTLWVDSTGDWWASTATDNANGQWRKLTGPTTAGALHILPAPVRVYDSRPAQPPITVGQKVPLAPSSPRQIDVTQNTSGVAVAARAALITVTATNPAGPGFVTVWPTGLWPGTSSLNFSGPGDTVATTTTVGLVSASFLAQSNTSVDVVIDVIGYYL